MNIVDTNGVDHILRNNIILQNDHFLVPDVSEEVEMTQLIHGRRIPPRILEIAQHPLFSEAIYLNHYNRILNKYGGRSFYNMTGFGDVSIIAALHMFADVFQEQRVIQLFDPTEQILVYTNDGSLTTKIAAEFPRKDIHVRAISGIR